MILPPTGSLSRGSGIRRISKGEKGCNAPSFLSPLLPSHPLPLRSRPLKPGYGAWGSAVSFPRGVRSGTEHQPKSNSAHIALESRIWCQQCWWFYWESTNQISRHDKGRWSLRSQASGVPSLSIPPRTRHSAGWLRPSPLPQWSFRKTGPVATLASQADMGVWVVPESAPPHAHGFSRAGVVRCGWVAPSHCAGPGKF